MPTLNVIATAFVAVLVGLEAILVAYLLLLTGSAVLAQQRPRRVGSGPTRRRFAILVPAHNEQSVIGRLLTSLADLDYPRDKFDVCVAADNCDDRTASIARSRGARVYERFDTDAKAKGFALRWLIGQLTREARAYDAYVIIDADSVVAPNLLGCMNAHLERGERVVQAYYSVLNPGDSAVAALRFAALAAVHYLRPLGRSLFGLSSGLKGNGMCFDASIIHRFDWRWFTLAEDVEFHLALVEQGIGVKFAPETWVKADMPVTLRQATSQNVRWERGRLQLIRQHVPRLVLGGLRQRSLLQLDAAVEQLIPPLSVPFALGVAVAPAAWLLNSPGLTAAAVVSLGAYCLYLTVALALVRAPLQIYCALALAPVYVTWKLGIYARSILTPWQTAWIRTARTPSAGTSA